MTIKAKPMWKTSLECRPHNSLENSGGDFQTLICHLISVELSAGVRHQKGVLPAGRPLDAGHPGLVHQPLLVVQPAGRSVIFRAGQL